MFSSVDVPEILEMSNHPVHIIDSNGNITPSAFIQFCSIAGNSDILGQRIEKFKYPVCTKFKPEFCLGRCATSWIQIILRTR